MIIKTLLVLTCLASSAMASTLAFATGGGRGHQFVLSDSATRVAEGSLVKLGYLTDPGATSSFVEFGRSTITNPSPSILIGGFLTVPVSNTNPAQNVAAQGKQIYLWVYNSPAEATATQHGLFTSTNNTWIIPSTFTGGAVESSNVTLGASAAPAFGPVTALLGSYATGNVTVSTGTNAAGSIYSLAPIPEPTVGVLALFALLGVTRRKR